MERVTGTIQLNAIAGEVWPTDDALVGSFRNTLQQGRSVDALRLRTLANGQAEVLDGFHRLVALRAEGRASYDATFEECDDRTADLVRAETSIKKPSPVLERRARQVIRDTFIRDMRDTLYPEEVKLRERRLCDRPGSQRGMEIVERVALLPDTPEAVLLAYVEHEACYGDSQHQKYDPGYVWSHQVFGWLSSISYWFGQSYDWLVTDVLGITVLDSAMGSDDRAHMIAPWQQLLRIDDREIRDTIIAKAKREKRRLSDIVSNTTELGLRAHLPARYERAAILRMLHTMPWSDIQHHIWDDLAKETASKSEAVKQQRAVAVQQKAQRASEQLQSDAIFAVASPQFTLKRPGRAIQNTTQDLTAEILTAISHLIELTNEYRGLEPTFDAQLSAGFARLIEWARQLPITEH